jgi:hypothetical protein
VFGRFVIRMLLCFVLTMLTLSGASSSAYASDGSSGNTGGSVGASAGGGQVTVAAGTTISTPSSGGGVGGGSGGSSSGGSAPNPYECTYTVASSQIQQFLGPGGSTPGEWVVYVCPGTAVAGDLPLQWQSTAQTQGQTPVNLPALVEQAVSKLGLTSPTIEMAPPDGTEQLVGVPTWLWIESGAWHSMSAMASAGTVSATATATPSKVVWNMGDGNQTTCDGPGTPYVASDPNAATNCSYTWAQAGSYQVAVTLYWSVTWTAAGAPGGGNLGLQAGPATEVPVTVTESQAINTPASGSN